MKNYYEILELNPKASKEIIDKAYKVLVKKYHPDLYTGQKKQYAEKKIKEINEAYYILSDEFLKEQYDNELQKEKERKNDNTQALQKTKVNPSSTTKKGKDAQNEKNTKTRVGSFNSVIQLTKELIQDIAKSKEKRNEIKDMTKRDLIAIILTIVVVILLGIALWFIPFTNGWIRELLFENPLFNWIGGLFS